MTSRPAIPSPGHTPALVLGLRGPAERQAARRGRGLGHGCAGKLRGVYGHARRLRHSAPPPKPPLGIAGRRVLAGVQPCEKCPVGPPGCALLVGIQCNNSTAHSKCNGLELSLNHTHGSMQKLPSPKLAFGASNVGRRCRARVGGAEQPPRLILPPLAAPARLRPRRSPRECGVERAAGELWAGVLTGRTLGGRGHSGEHRGWARQREAPAFCLQPAVSRVSDPHQAPQW
ncbi:PREDICTED: uncharacterized protein LOC106146874 [Chinchilla lanigera]|uniref:uncharacterized protein LOC106146874 n=1 Tax=Chinchilla lanigera TaxID=34839 RepID=UPI000698380C|nr:PREDICTED: uncharacterized protein LOC106146874 [Chinchilla lanigera]